MRAGLIPSRALQEKRILHERSERAERERGTNSLLCAGASQNIPENGTGVVFSAVLQYSGQAWLNSVRRTARRMEGRRPDAA